MPRVYTISGSGSPTCEKQFRKCLKRGSRKRCLTRLSACARKTGEKSRRPPGVSLGVAKADQSSVLITVYRDGKFAVTAEACMPGKRGKRVVDVCAIGSGKNAHLAKIDALDVLVKRLRR